jgi:hypothetical protein
MEKKKLNVKSFNDKSSQKCGDFLVKLSIKGIYNKLTTKKRYYEKVIQYK